jgi:hypothetical protein
LMYASKNFLSSAVSIDGFFLDAFLPLAIMQ